MMMRTSYFKFSFLFVKYSNHVISKHLSFEIDYILVDFLSIIFLFCGLSEFNIIFLSFYKLKKKKKSKIELKKLSNVCV